MKYDRNKSYTGDELDALVKEAKDYATSGTLKRIEKEYISRDKFAEIESKYSSLENTYKTEKFDTAFKTVSNKYGVNDKKAEYIKTLGKISIDDTPEVIETKIKNVKVDLPELFNHTSVQLGPNKETQDSKTKEDVIDQTSFLNPTR